MMKYLLTSLFILLGMLSTTAQKQMTIKFTPDAFPQDITWELQTQDYRTILAQGDLSGCQAFEECVVFDEMVEDRCYTLLIRDRTKDGIDLVSGGGYTVFFDGKVMVNPEEFSDKVYHDFNCSEGETCALAIQLDLPDNKIYAPDTKEYWFKFTPQEDGHYRINTCDNRLTGVGVADTELWYYTSCNRDLHTNGAEGAESHSDDEANCAPGSGFNFIPLEAGVEYFIRHKPQQDWINIPKDDSLKIKVQKLPVRSGCIDNTACNYDPFAQLDNGSCVYDEGCLPDLSLDTFELRESIIVDTVFSNDLCYVEEGCLRGPGPREVIRFSTKIDNIGNADYWVGRPENSENLFSQENCHGHYHHLGYAEYLLYQGEGQPTPVGFKSGFCVLDLDCSEAGGTLPKYICANMGITVGCSDIYDSDIDCQWIDITDIEDGEYTIIVRVNQFELVDARGLPESTYENNVGRACVDIDRSSGKLVVTVLEECEEYRDCAGIINGKTEKDCNGVCGGDAHWGDLDGSGALETGDLESYLDLLVNKMTDSELCLDLNGDGRLSIFDADLVGKCLQETIDNETNPFHEHCSFPDGSDTETEMGSLRISEFNPSARTFVVEGWFADRDLSAYQIGTAGIQIHSVEQLYSDTADYFLHNNETIFAIHNTDNLDRNSGYQPLVRITYAGVTSDSICLTAQSEMINVQHNRINLEMTSVCEFVTSTADLPELTKVTILPNPAKNRLNVIAEGYGVRSYAISTVTGGMILSPREFSGSLLEVDLQGIPDGIYLIQLQMTDGQQVTRRFVVSK